jgi:hypothetical protein
MEDWYADIKAEVQGTPMYTRTKPEERTVNKNTLHRYPEDLQDVLEQLLVLTQEQKPYELARAESTGKRVDMDSSIIFNLTQAGYDWVSESMVHATSVLSRIPKPVHNIKLRDSMIRRHQSHKVCFDVYFCYKQGKRPVAGFDYRIVVKYVKNI